MLDLIIVPRVRDLGAGFSVRRALPHAKRQMVGPFIFFDQMGSVQLIAGRGMDVRPHPHIGLATVTYLFDGRVVHRDSQGNALEITPGAMNLSGSASRQATFSHGPRNGVAPPRTWARNSARLPLGVPPGRAMKHPFHARSPKRPLLIPSAT